METSQRNFRPDRTRLALSDQRIQVEDGEQYGEHDEEHQPAYDQDHQWPQNRRCHTEHRIEFPLFIRRDLLQHFCKLSAAFAGGHESQRN